VHVGVLLKQVVQNKMLKLKPSFYFILFLWSHMLKIHMGHVSRFIKPFLEIIHGSKHNSQVKVKVKFSLCRIMNHTIKTQRAEQIWLPVF